MLRTFEDRMSREGSLRLLAHECLDVVTTGLRSRFAVKPALPRVKKGTVMELLFRDLRHAARSLVKNPSFSIVAIAALALGIGANSATFSLVNAALLKPLPVENPENLVAIYATRGNESFPLNFSYPNYRDLAEVGLFEHLVGFQGANVSIDTRDGEPELVWGELVTENYFTGLGVDPAVGRTFLPEDADRPVVVLSYELWRRRFGARDSVLGSRARLNGHEFEVVGVAREGFTGAKFLGFTPDVYVPVTMHEVIWRGSEGRLDRRQGGWLNVRGRLEPGTSLSEVEAALGTVARRLEAEYPDVNRDLRFHAMAAPRKVEPVVEVELGGVLPIVSTVLLTIVGIVLLIACANVASLTMARTLAAEREIAVRLSLGATRARLVREIVLQSLLLVVVASLIGGWLGDFLLQAAIGLGPVLDFGVDYGVATDWRVFLFTAAITGLAGILSGLLPAWNVARRDTNLSLKEGGRTPSRTRWRRFLVIPQVALALVGLVAAGLLVLSFENARSSSPGFATDGLLLATIDLDLQGYGEERGESFYRDVVERLKGVPGVLGVSLGFPLPLDAYSEGDRILAEGAEPGSSEEGGEGILVFYSTVSEDFFEVMETPLLHGRAFEASDDLSSRPVAIVNETLAQRFWPGENAIGKRFRRADGSFLEVVGIARDGKYFTLGEEARSFYFLPLRQFYRTPMTVVVRTDAPPMSLEPSLRGEVRALDPTLPVYGVKTIGEFLARSLAGPRALALSVSFFAALAVTLAMVGVYGLMSFLVSQKRRELGIRMALGASRWDVLLLFLKQSTKIVSAGIAAGLVLAWASTRVMGSILFGVEASNPGVFFVVALLLLVLSLAGSFFPSRRATKLDPLVTLRHD
jgi:predicted permease